MAAPSIRERLLDAALKSASGANILHEEDAEAITSVIDDYLIDPAEGEQARDAETVMGDGDSGDEDDCGLSCLACERRDSQGTSIWN